MPLKYQHEIDGLGLTETCPAAVTVATGIEAFRFCYHPITHNLNFLPNVVFDRQKGVAYNYSRATSEQKCSRCGASFYTTLAIAVNRWNSLPERVRENLGYTHLAQGTLVEEDGLITEEKRGHFGLYEDVQADLPSKFAIVEEL